MTKPPPLRVALAQVRCPWADREGNLERMAGWAERAKREGAKLEAPFWQAHGAQPTFPVLGRRAAVSLCWDNKYPELLAHYEREGAEVVLMPHAWDSDVLDEDAA